jgi:spermidine/putrescine-binding protein
LYRKLSQLPKGIPDNNLAKEFLDFINALGICLNCNANPVTQAAYQQFMIDWNSAPQPVQGATWVQALLWKWLYISFPADRSKYFAAANEPDILKHKKTVARSRRLEGLNDLISDYIARAQS